MSERAVRREAGKITSFYVHKRFYYHVQKIYHDLEITHEFYEQHEWVEVLNSRTKCPCIAQTQAELNKVKKMEYGM